MIPTDGHEGPVMTAHRAGLIGCRGCGRVWPDAVTVCGRCGRTLVPPDRRCLNAVWAWLVAGLIFYIPANMFPMLKTSTLGGLMGNSEATILGGVVELIHYDSYGVAAVVFIASIVVPISKFIIITWLALVAGRPATVTAAYPQGRFGALVLDGERVTQFQEKPKGDGGMINAGFFVLSPKVLDLIEGDATHDLARFLVQGGHADRDPQNLVPVR